MHPSADLEALWRHLEAHFDNESAHQAFLDACVERHDLSFAARRYRDVAEHSEDAASQERARVQLGKLSGLAFSLLKSNTKPLPELKKITTWVGAAVCAILLLALAFAFRG